MHANMDLLFHISTRLVRRIDRFPQGRILRQMPNLESEPYHFQMMPYEVVTGFCRTAEFAFTGRVAIDMNLRKGEPGSWYPSFCLQPFAEMPQERPDIHAGPVEFIRDDERIPLIIVLPN